jgi:hypothetical protein
MVSSLNRITGELKDDTILWRYMNVSKFLSLLYQRSLWLARTDTFKDKKEGVFNDSMKKELNNIYQKLSEKKDFYFEKIKNADDFQEYLINNTYINCWHKNLDENMIMWEVYGRTKNSVAIKTTAKKLKDSLDSIRVNKFALHAVLDEVSYPDNYENVLSEKSYHQSFFIKRPHFSFENEVRLCLLARDKVMTKSQSPLGCEITVDLSSLIKEIYVHPDSEDWFFELIKDLVKKYDINANVIRGVYGNT